LSFTSDSDKLTLLSDKHAFHLSALRFVAFRPACARRWLVGIAIALCFPESSVAFSFAKEALMTTHSLEKIGRRALWISPVVIVIGGFFAALHWLKPQNATFVMVLSAAVAIFGMGYCSFLARRMQRRLDEVQIAHQEFANSRGWVWGLGVASLLLMLPPVTDWLIHLANMLSTGSPDRSNRTSVQVALFFGLTLVALVQTVCIIVAAVIWERRMRVPEQS
jgi:hypothetical protein